MANYYEVPLTPEPQRISVVLAGRTWFLTVYWNDICGKWIVDFADQDQVVQLAGIPIVAGIDMLGQHQHLGFGGSLVVQTDANAYEDPTLTDLGLGSRVIFVTE